MLVLYTTTADALQCYCRWSQVEVQHPHCGEVQESQTSPVGGPFILHPTLPKDHIKADGMRLEMMAEEQASRGGAASRNHPHPVSSGSTSCG